MRRLVPLLTVLACACASNARAQAPCPQGPSGAALESPIPRPTGAAAVGRSSFFVAGGGSANAPAPPDMMVHMWYPAQAATGLRAPYIGGWSQVREAVTEPARRLLRDAYCAFEQGRVFSHAIENTPVAHGRFPLLLFAHGLGITGFAYAAQLEDLASHGYVVAAVEYTPAAAFVVFPGNRVGTFDAPRWDALAKLPEDSLELTQFEKTQIEAGAHALRAAFDEIVRRNASGPLSGRVDFDRVGVFGHSVGGMFVIRALQIEPRFRAGLAQDALGQGVRAFAAEGGKQMRSRVALFFRPVRPGQQAELDELFNALPIGTLLATPASQGFAHMSFSDLLLLRAGDNAEARAAPLRHLAIVRTMTRSFFDHALRGATAPPTTLAAQGYPELTTKISGN